MKLCGYLMQFNESSRGNLRRCLESMSCYVDNIVVYDDASTDDSVSVIREFTDHVILGERNDFANEISHRQQLLASALALSPDYILWLDADEVICRRGAEGGLRALCETGKSFNFDKITLWRSQTWCRLDYLGTGRFLHLWQNTGHLTIPSADGLHQQPFPNGLGELGTAPHIRVLHFGYATQESIERRWRERTKLGLPIGFRRNGIDERKMQLKAVPLDWFPAGVDVPRDEPMPTPIRYHPEIMQEAGLS